VWGTIYLLGCKHDCHVLSPAAKDRTTLPGSHSSKRLAVSINDTWKGVLQTCSSLYCCVGSNLLTLY
jgi:hypothetical protein